MTLSVIQQSFNTGEWAPALNARVDLQKYHNGAALLRNFFVDYRGGASTRAGTKYVIQCLKLGARLIPFQASFTVSYVIELGDGYMRFVANGAAVLEAATTVTGATQANPGSFTDNAHGYLTGDWVYAASFVGMTQVNGRYFIVVKTGANTFTLTNLLGVAVNTSTYGAYVSGGTFQRVYTLPSPYTASELALVKIAQNINTLILCHPNHQPYVLTLISAANWTLTPIVFGATILAPTGIGVATTLAAGNVNYAYLVTSVDAGGQESGPSSVGVLASKTDLRTVAGTNTISWTARSGAVSYNVYKAELSYAGAVPSGAAFGFIGFTTAVSLVDSNIAPNFDFTPPIPQNPFQGAGVAFHTVTAPGTYTVVPGVVVDAAPSGGQTAIANAVLQVQGTPAVSGAGGTGYNIGDSIVLSNGVVLIVATLTSGTRVATVQPITFPGSNPGAVTGVGSATPTNPVAQVSSSGVGTAAAFTLVWGVGQVQNTSPGSGYTSTPADTFSAGGAAATVTLAPSSNGNPTVPIYFDQRLALMGPPGSPQQFNMSKPGAYYNYDISNPIEPDDAIEGTLVSGQLNTIKSAISMPSGLVILSDRQAWVVNGGAAGTPIDPINATAHSQAYNGASDVPPIVANYDILYVQSKGSIVRDLTYNFYTNVYTGTDISVLSSHLFYGYTVSSWAWCEEPFKVVWAVRNDGTLLSLTFLKEQELIGWTHSDTNGLFKSVSTISESVSFGTVDALYTIIQRTISATTVQYIERMAERIFPNGATDAWCVDAGLQYSGAPATNFTGGEHLAGMTVTGLADGLVITPFVMSAAGTFTLAVAASKVTVGLAFTPQLQTLQLDIGEPTIQGKRKKIAAVTARCQDTLGLWMGKTFSTLVAMKDLVLGNVGSASNTVVTNLVTADARTIIDPSWDVPGQYCFSQPYPLPATILGVIPEIVVGDTGK